MNRFSMLSTGPKASSKVFMPGKPSDVPTPGVRALRTPRIAPKAASTRMYGKEDPAPGADMFGSTEKKYV